MISKSSSVLRSIGNKNKHRGNDFDQVALISDNDDIDDEEDSARENSKPVKKIKGKNKKKYKPKLGRNLSDPTSNSKAFSRHEAEQMDGLKLQDEKLDPKEGVLQNLKKKHGMFNGSSNRKTTRFNESLDESRPQEVKGAKSSRSRARILKNSEIDESKVFEISIEEIFCYT